MNARFPPPPNENERFVRPSFLSSCERRSGERSAAASLLRFRVGLRRKADHRGGGLSLSLLSLYQSIELTCTYHHMRHPLTAPGILGIRDKLSDSYQITE